MRRTAYDKQAVILDIIQKLLCPAEISEKYGITINNVYLIKAAAVRAGIVSSRGHKNIEERMHDENSVFTPELREKIKDMREQDLTTTEITNLLIQKGIQVRREDVEKVMARGANEYAGNVEMARHRLGRVIRG